ncbi:MAG TPA: type II and III secretion system protein family protein [Caulobacteraceae bacterium]|nr:type II and III secretion system protein family protein [Caulobacteraceae bacterium]
MRTASALTAALLVALPGAEALAQSTVKVELGASGASSRSLSLPRGKSAIVELPVDARDVLVSNPAVADAVLRTPRRIYVLGVAPGQTDAVFFDGAGRQILSLDIRVDAATGAVQDTIKRVVPDADVQVEPVGDSLILTGSVATLGDSDRVQRIAEKFVAKPEQVLNMLSVAGKDQVTLKVRVVEVQRNTLKQFGFNTQAVLGQLGTPQYFFGNNASFAVNGGLQGGLTGGYQHNTTTQAVLPNASQSCSTPSTTIDRSNPANCVVTGRAGSGGLNQAQGVLQAFERVGLVRTLAEPNLTAISGESAKFLAGGEFPVPVGLDQNGNVIVEFKPFGVGLGFSPMVISEGRISLKISTEVSELTADGSLKLTEELTIPALNVRRAETVVELPSGGSLMIAGLLQEKTKQNIDSLPGVTTLPVLGSLFRSRDYLAGETELVVIVTPYLVKPTRAGELQTPADGLQIASDMETILLGKLNKTYRGDKTAAAASDWQGPVGYVID